MGLPHYATELAAARLSPAHVTRAAIQAEIYDPAGAVEAGYLDRVVPAEECEQAAIEEARRLGQLRTRAHRHTKLGLPPAVIALVPAHLAAASAPNTPPHPYRPNTPHTPPRPACTP